MASEISRLEYPPKFFLLKKLLLTYGFNPLELKKKNIARKKHLDTFFSGSISRKFDLIIFIFLTKFFGKNFN